jgi:hypothetical protein
MEVQNISLRDQQITLLRPEIIFSDIPQPLADFQAELRKILKLQNPILVKITLHFLSNKYKGFIQREDNVKKELLLQSLKKDIPFKKMLIGFIIGLFTESECETYLANEQEINKRLVEFLYKRLATQLV